MIWFKKKPILILTIMIFLVYSSIIGFANSAEPPTLTIIVPFAPEGLKLELSKEADVDRARVEDKLIENAYIFYLRAFDIKSTLYLTVEHGDELFNLQIKGLEQRYNSVYTLDLDKRTLTPGKQPLRSVILISLRMSLTLLTEGLIFWLFAFRQKTSWQVFLWVNLITQGLLNLWINTMPIQIGYGILMVAFAEILILLVETVIFTLVLKEHTKLRRCLYAFIANALSLVGGMIIITALPI